jgi:hypothetical protein
MVGWIDGWTEVRRELIKRRRARGEEEGGNGSKRTKEVRFRTHTHNNPHTYILSNIRFIW